MTPSQTTPHFSRMASSVGKSRGLASGVSCGLVSAIRCPPCRSPNLKALSSSLLSTDNYFLDLEWSPPYLLPIDIAPNDTTVLAFPVFTLKKLLKSSTSCLPTTPSPLNQDNIFVTRRRSFSLSWALAPHSFNSHTALTANISLKAGFAIYGRARLNIPSPSPSNARRYSRFSGKMTHI